MVTSSIIGVDVEEHPLTKINICKAITKETVLFIFSSSLTIISNQILLANGLRSRHSSRRRPPPVPDRVKGGRESTLQKVPERGKDDL